ncbi:hypothetical protein HWD31_gp05 [Pantoea phage vB_PagM_SSEM1]|uniref:Uncharacterized protein n=1 Tax=Pantoea phage vB_PagM_SSEM1 TaxID=2721760 RepID=A0A6H0D9V9_9CAUD|nr:hypothetical protein HWD31_gp05 [Pantoea phage vB_PagM_SSEM1]QIS79381.1 hypothetical protein SSEM1_gp05 [Pantoea phage vB_PagM_SSEM1]
MTILGTLNLYFFLFFVDGRFTAPNSDALNVPNTFEC